MTEKEKEEWGETVKVTATDNSDEWGETVVVDPKSKAPSMKGGESGALVRPLTPTSASEGSESESWTQTVNPFADKGAVKPTQQAGAAQAPKAKLLKVIPSSEKKSPELLKARVDTYGDMYKRAMDRAYTLKQSVEGVDNELKNSKAYVDSNPNDQNAINSYNALISKRNEMAEMARMEISRADAWQKGIEKTQLEIDESLTASESISNSISNMATQIKGFLPASGLAISTLQNKIQQGAMYVAGKLMGADDETASRVSTELSQNLPSAGILGTTQKEARQFYTERLGELEKEQKPTKSIIKTFEEGDIAGLGAAILDGGSSVISSVITSAPTGGVGIFTEMMGRSVYDSNNEKAKRLKISVDELYDRGLDEAAVPLAIGAVSASLEKIGLDGISKAINKKIGSKALKDVFEIILEGSKEAGTEWLQTGAEEYNKAIARGMNAEQAGEAALSKMLSEEGREAALKGAAGSGVSIATGRAAKSLYSIAKSNRDKLYQDLAKVETLARERANPNLSSEALASIDREINNTTANMQKEVLDQLNRRANLTEENASLVEGIEANVKTISDDIESKKLLSEDPSLSDDAKIIIDLEIADLEAKRLDLAAQSEEIIKNNRPVTLTKNTSPTSEKYGTINRNDGKGVVDLTKEEYEAEQAKMQPKVDEQATPTAEGEQVPKTKEEIDAEIERLKKEKEKEIDKETPVKNENITVDFGGGVSVKYQVITYKDGSVKISTSGEKAKRYSELSNEAFKDYAKIDFEPDAKSIIKTEVIKDDYTDKQSQEIKAAKEKTINAKYDSQIAELEKQNEKEPTKKEDGEPMSGGVQGLRTEGQAGKESAELRTEEEEVTPQAGSVGVEVARKAMSKEIDSQVSAKENELIEKQKQDIEKAKKDLEAINSGDKSVIDEYVKKSGYKLVTKEVIANNPKSELLKKSEGKYYLSTGASIQVKTAEQIAIDGASKKANSKPTGNKAGNNQYVDAYNAITKFSEGKITAEEAKSIIEKAGLKIPKAVEQSLKATPQAGSVGVGGDKIKLDPDLANIDPILIAARNGDVAAQKQFEEMGLDWKQTTTYRFVGQSEVDVLLSNEKVESKRGMADAGIDVTSSPKVTTAATGEYRVTFKESFDKNNGLGKVRKKNEEDSNLERGRGYDINDVAKIERIDEKGNVVETIYDQSKAGSIVEVESAYGNFLLNEIDKRHKEKYNGENIKSALAKQFNETLADRGENRAISNLEDVYMNYVPEGVKPQAYQALRKNFEKEQSLKETPQAASVSVGGEVDLTTVEYKQRYPKTHEVVFVDPSKVLDRLTKDDPDYDVQNKKNQIGSRVQKAKDFILNYAKDKRWINPKTGVRSETTKAEFEPSIAQINNGKISFEDGRHRILAAKELGIGKVAIEVPKGQANQFKKDFEAAEQSLKETPTTEEKVSGGLTQEEKTNLENISKDAGVNFQEVRNVYNKYGDGKPLNEITLEDYQKAEEKRQGGKEKEAVEEKEEASPKEKLFSKVRAYNNLSKRERSDMFGNKLRSDIMSDAAAIKYTIRPTKSGNYILIDDRGKQVRAIGIPRSKDVIQEEKRTKERRSRAKRELPLSIKHSVAQDIANGVKFNRKELKDVTGWDDADIPFWLTVNEGGVSLEFYNVRFQEKGGFLVEDDMNFVSDVADAIRDFAFNKGRTAALEFIEKQQEIIENGGFTDAELQEQMEYYQAKLDEENFDYFAEYLSNLSDEEAQLLSDELREAEKENDKLLINEILNENEDQRKTEQGEQDANIEALDIEREGKEREAKIAEIEENIKNLQNSVAKKQRQADKLSKEAQGDVFRGTKAQMFDAGEELRQLTKDIREQNAEIERQKEKLAELKEKQIQPSNQLKIQENAKKQQSGQMREQGVQDQPQRKGDSDMPIINEAELQDGETVEEEVEEEGLPKLTKEQQIEAERRSLNEPKNVSDLAKIFNKVLGLSPKESVMAARLFDVKAKNMSELLGITKDEYYQRYWFTGEQEGGLSQMTLPDGRKVTVKSVSAEVVNGFYSNTENALGQVKQEKMSGNQWATQLLSRGANKEEMQWTGLEAFLKENAAKPISKADIQQFLKDNRIQVVEVVKSDDKIENNYSIRQDDDVFDVMKNGVYSKKSFGTIEEAEAYINSQEPEIKENTKFSQYQLEGEKSNYAEKLVILPNKEINIADFVDTNADYIIEAYKKSGKLVVEC